MNESVLVVEDDADLRTTLCHVLSCLGFGVDAACDAVDARVRLAQHRPDVMLLDLFLGGAACNAFLDDLAHLEDSPPVVLCSATPPAADLLSTRYSISFLAKPFDVERLIDAIEDAHRTHRRPSLHRCIADVSPTVATCGATDRPRLGVRVSR